MWTLWYCHKIKCLIESKITSIMKHGRDLLCFYVQKRNFNWMHVHVLKLSDQKRSKYNLPWNISGSSNVHPPLLLYNHLNNWTSQSKSDYHASTNQTFVQPASSKNTIQRLRLVVRQGNVGLIDNPRVWAKLPLIYFVSSVRVPCVSINCSENSFGWFEVKTYSKCIGLLIFIK